MKKQINKQINEIQNILSHWNHHQPLSFLPTLFGVWIVLISKKIILILIVFEPQ